MNSATDREARKPAATVDKVCLLSLSLFEYFDFFFRSVLQQTDLLFFVTKNDGICGMGGH